MIKDYEGFEISIITDEEEERILVIAYNYEVVKIHYQYSWQGIPTAQEFEKDITTLLENNVSIEDIERELDCFRTSDFYKELYKWHNDPCFVG